MTSECRLVGGPFDGDEGSMDEPLPAQLWATVCDQHPRGRCPAGGTHWLVPKPDATDEPPGERYRRGALRAGVRLYIHHGMSLDFDPEARRSEELIAA